MTPVQTDTLAQPAALPRPTPWLEAADRIGRTMVREAVWWNERCSWLVWNTVPVDGVFRPALCAASVNLYAGTAGIALFLARLAHYTGDPQQEAVRDGAVRQVLAQLEAELAPGFPGYYSGGLGAAHAVVSIGELTGNGDWIEAGIRHAEALAGHPAERREFDMLSGRAGAIAPLLDLGRRYGRDRLIDAAVAHGDALVESAVGGPDGMAWASDFGETRPLLGLSHGTSGVLLALLELNRVRPEGRYLTTVREALRYERRWFDPVQCNWPDFRTIPGQPVGAPSFPVAWCHGSVGIGIARLRVHRLLPDDAAVLPELDAAVASAAGFLNQPIGPTNDFSPCHGVAAAGEFMLMVAETFGRADAQAAAERVGQVGIQMFHDTRNPWGCGVPGCGETFSLMTGTAGIGHFYLRLHAGAAVPTMLLPPIPA